MVFWVPILSWSAALLFAVVATLKAPAPRGPLLWARKLLAGLNLFPVGLMGLWAALGHIAFPEQSARAIGWATSPFQFEVGVANLGIGLAGLIAAFWANWGFRAAVAVMVAGFLGGAAVGHLVQISATGNMAAGNAGPILYTDIFTPLALLILLALTFRDRRA